MIRMSVSPTSYSITDSDREDNFKIDGSLANHPYMPHIAKKKDDILSDMAANAQKWIKNFQLPTPFINPTNYFIPSKHEIQQLSETSSKTEQWVELETIHANSHTKEDTLSDSLETPCHSEKDSIFVISPGKLPYNNLTNMVEESSSPSLVAKKYNQKSTTYIPKGCFVLTDKPAIKGLQNLSKIIYDEFETENPEISPIFERSFQEVVSSTFPVWQRRSQSELISHSSNNNISKNLAFISNYNTDDLLRSIHPTHLTTMIISLLLEQQIIIYSRYGLTPIVIFGEIMKAALLPLK
jgi:hypothetical protein